MKEKYVVYHVPTDTYLANNYYRHSICTAYLSEAHKFSAFELKLASVYLLLNKKNYKVYKYKELTDKEIILDVDKRFNGGNYERG